MVSHVTLYLKRFLILFHSGKVIEFQCPNKIFEKKRRSKIEDSQNFLFICAHWGQKRILVKIETWKSFYANLYCLSHAQCKFFFFVLEKSKFESNFCNIYLRTLSGIITYIPKCKNN